MPWLPDWVINMVLDLGRAGLGEQAAALADALASVDSDHQALYQADAGVALAEAGRPEQARAKVAANLDAWPDDFWVTGPRRRRPARPRRPPRRRGALPGCAGPSRGS
jgi:hypothetical protein